MATIDAQRLAECFIHHAQNHGDLLTNLRLQKFLYYAQGWYLALHEEPLFDEPIEAWLTGPVVPSVFAAYRRFRFRPIDSVADLGDVDPAIFAHIDEVVLAYGGMSTYELELTTRRETPWREARAGLPDLEPHGRVIDIGSMREFFKAELAHADPTYASSKVCLSLATRSSANSTVR